MQITEKLFKIKYLTEKVKTASNDNKITFISVNLSNN